MQKGRLPGTAGAHLGCACGAERVPVAGNLQNPDGVRTGLLSAQMHQKGDIGSKPECIAVEQIIKCSCSVSVVDDFDLGQPAVGQDGSKLSFAVLNLLRCLFERQSFCPGRRVRQVVIAQCQNEQVLCLSKEQLRRLRTVDIWPAEPPAVFFR